MGRMAVPADWILYPAIFRQNGLFLANVHHSATLKMNREETAQHATTKKPDENISNTAKYRPQLTQYIASFTCLDKMPTSLLTL
jgi:hypothetical protein